MDARDKYRALAPSYDRSVRFSDRLRERAIGDAVLRVGDVVLDVGCGTGLSLPLLQRGVGPSGRLVGLEQSPEMLDQARARVQQAGWTNVTFVQASAQDAAIPVRPDVLVFFLTHDIVRSEAALENVFGAAKPGARVLVAGAKWAPWWALPVNLVVWQQARRYTTTLEGFRRPWDRIRRFAPDLQVQPVLAGTGYIAHGVARA